MFHSITDMKQLELEQPDTIIEKELGSILRQRAAVRALPRVKLDALFDQQELCDLRDLFASATTKGKLCIAC